MINRSLSIMLDGEPMPFAGRIRLRGEDALSLFPALFTLEMWNLPEELFLRLSRARGITVSHEGASLISGRIWDVFRQGTDEGILTSVSVSLGLELWEAAVSLTIPAGTSVSDAVRRILSASGTGIPLLSFPGTDPVSLRSQSFFGRAAECIFEVLLGHSSLVPSGLSASASSCHSERSEESFRAMLTPSGLMLVPPGGLPESVRITDADLTDTVSFAGGSLRGTKQLAVISAVVAGWRPGQTVEVCQGNISFRGIIVSRSVDADTASGPWKCEMICEVL